MYITEYLFTIRNIDNYNSLKFKVEREMLSELL